MTRVPDDPAADRLIAEQVLRQDVLRCAIGLVASDTDAVVIETRTGAIGTGDLAEDATVRFRGDTYEMAIRPR
ncbi:MAG: hypothetical protein ABEJ76_02135 [Halanaeroarchaeum sp.]